MRPNWYRILCIRIYLQNKFLLITKLSWVSYFGNVLLWQNTSFKMCVLKTQFLTSLRQSALSHHMLSDLWTNCFLSRYSLNKAYSPFHPKYDKCLSQVSIRVTYGISCWNFFPFSFIRTSNLRIPIFQIRHLLKIVPKLFCKSTLIIS